MRDDPRWRVRPSVAITPVQRTEDIVVCEAFLSNTRVTKRYAVKAPLFDQLVRLDGTRTHEQVQAEASRNGLDIASLGALLPRLRDACILEDVDIVADLLKSPYRRIAMLLGDYLPDNHVASALHTLASSAVAVVGLGGVGSWIAHFLTRSGIGSLVLVDPDRVQSSNLNRSRYQSDDVGRLKAESLEATLRGIRPDLQVHRLEHFLGSRDDALSIVDRVRSCGQPAVVVNCADEPDVDRTNLLLGEACMQHRVPHVVAGGYNLHLSLMGPSVVPFETPCLECIRVQLGGDGARELLGLRKLNRPLRKLGSIVPLVGIVASFAASEVFRTLLRSDRLRGALEGRRGEYNVLTDTLSFSRFERLADCRWCGQQGAAG